MKTAQVIPFPSDEDWRDLICPFCDGYGSWSEETGTISKEDGSPEFALVNCHICNGRGGFMQQVEPITLEDLDEAT